MVIKILILMFVNIIKLDPCPCEIPKESLHEVAPVDQFGAQVFCLGENGFSSSPLVVALRTQDEQLRQAILSGIQERSKVDSDMTDEELIKSIVPRSVQTPAEIARFVEVFHQMHPVAEPPVTVDEPSSDTHSVESAEVVS